ncbi:MAG TPA: LPXTG cell wall anchor domain-containing protein [Bryobacteraceae bacterium]
MRPRSTAPAEELPKTGSFMPLIGLLGVIGLAMGALLAWIHTRVTKS